MQTKSKNTLLETDSRLIEKMMGLDFGESIRDLLEDFEFIGAGTRNIALIPSFPSNSRLSNNVRAALIATHLRLQSIDYTKRRYCKDNIENNKRKSIVSEYINSYKSAKNHVTKIISRLNPNKKGDPSVGVFGASIVLERLI